MYGLMYQKSRTVCPLFMPLSDDTFLAQNYLDSVAIIFGIKGSETWTKESLVKGGNGFCRKAAGWTHREPGSEVSAMLPPRGD